MQTLGLEMTFQMQGLWIQTTQTLSPVEERERQYDKAGADRVTGCQHSMLQQE